MHPAEQHCSVYELAGDLVVLSDSRTKDGVLIFNGFAERVPVGADDSDLGASVLRALEASRSGVARPQDWAAFEREAKVSLNGVGVSSFLRLHRSARLVSVSRGLSDVTVTPHESGGARGSDRGFHEIGDFAESLVGGSDGDLGGKIRAAFERCR